jgi:alpha-tubulin suppressor-like RCC1 family protein
MAATLALALGCNNTLYDAHGIPPLGELVCSAPGTHACHAIRACMGDDDALNCEADCHACTTNVADARPVCIANTCGYECPAGLLKCEKGCCTSSSVAAGGDHACAITNDTGELLCWGANNDGQLGIGYDPVAGASVQVGTDQATPTKVALPRRVVSVGAGGAHSCAVLDTGAVWCWGRRSSYAGGKDYDFVPTEVAGLVGATAVASGGAHSCAIVAGGAVQCVGSWDPVGAVKDLPVVSDAKVLAAGDDFTCAIVATSGAASGVVQCWGANDHAQLGGGVAGTISQPVTVPLAPGVVVLGVGVHHSCASTAAGPLRCWSAKRVGTTQDLHDPFLPDGAGFAASALAGGQAHTCAVRAGSTDGVECWGNTAGDVVIGGTADAFGAPVHVPLAAPVAALAAGDFHTCASDGSGRVACWGQGGRGQLGDGAKSDSAAPVYVISH